MFSKLLLISSLFYASALSVSVNGGVDEWDLFYDFQDKFSKKYDDVYELEHRFIVFRSNVRGMIAHNANDTNTFAMDINQFSDLTAETKSSTPQELADMLDREDKVVVPLIRKLGIKAE